MSLREMLMVAYVVAAATFAWGVFASLDARREDRWRRRFLAVWPLIVAVFATINAALVAAVTSLGLAWLGGRAFGRIDPPAVLFVAIPTLSALTALLTWRACRIDPARRRLASMPNGSKPRSSYHHRDLE